MTQADYDLICEIITSGAPALSNRLINSLSKLVNDYQSLNRKLEVLDVDKTTQEDK